MIDIRKIAGMMREKGIGISDMAEAACIEKEKMREILWGRESAPVLVMCKIARRLGVGVEEIWKLGI